MTLEKIGKKMKKVKNDVKKKKEKNHGDNNRNIVNDTNISNDTIRFLELLAIRLPHKSPSSSTALQLLMTACDSIQGTEVSKEISNNPKHCLSIFENAFNKKENDNDLNNNSNNNTITSNTLINIDNIRKLIKKDTIITSIDNLINIVKANNFNENRYSLVQEMVKYYKNSDSKRSTKEDKFVTILNEKFLSFIVFSTNNNSDTDDCCIWGYIVAMTINNSNNTKNIKKLASTFNLMAIDNSKAIFMGMGFLGFWGICLNIYEYDDNKFSQLIKLFSSLLTAYLQSLHINGSNDSIIDIEMLILHPIILRCWLSKIKANSSSINELQDIILRYLLVVAQSTDNVWNILHPILEDTEIVKIDKDVINRGHVMCKKGLKELLNWFSSKAGMIDSACMALINEMKIPQLFQGSNKNKEKGHNDKDTQRIQINNFQGDEENYDEEQVSFSLDSTRDDTILKALEENHDFKNEAPNEMEKELSNKVGKKSKDDKTSKESDKKRKR